MDARVAGSASAAMPRRLDSSRTSSVVCYWDFTSCRPARLRATDIVPTKEKIYQSFLDEFTDFRGSSDLKVSACILDQPGINIAEFRRASVNLEKLARGGKETPMKYLFNKMVIDFSKKEEEKKGIIIVSEGSGHTPLTEFIYVISGRSYKVMIVVPGGEYEDAEELKHLDVVVKNWQNFYP